MTLYDVSTVINIYHTSYLQTRLEMSSHISTSCKFIRLLHKILVILCCNIVENIKLKAAHFIKLNTISFKEINLPVLINFWFIWLWINTNVVHNFLHSEKVHLISFTSNCLCYNYFPIKSQFFFTMPRSKIRNELLMHLYKGAQNIVSIMLTDLSVSHIKFTIFWSREIPIPT